MVNLPGQPELVIARLIPLHRLLALNGTSLGLALVSNAALLLNMARRLSFSIAQPITIFGWYLSSFLLIGDTSGITKVVKRHGQRRALTQAYYYAIFASSLYFLIASLMLITVYGAWKGHYRKAFKLTISQRTLMLQTISFMAYIVGGAGMYARVEGWQFLDSVMFTTFTLLTVGIGDPAPATHLGRSLLFPYAVGGIVILGLVVGSIRSLMLERGKEKLGSRMTEKKRRALVKRLMNEEPHKLTPIDDEKMDEKLMTEHERREMEFNLMRKVERATQAKQKWMALLFSGGVWLLLWFIGALIFYFAEREQRWTYFQSLYFAFTTLLTIGYGDYRLFSNSGKAFFVFWSLLAVPALTIVISNMGDTVVKLIKNATIYLGEFTILPGEVSAKDRLREVAGKVRRKGESKSPHALGNSKQQGSDMFWSSDAEYHFLLAREMRKVMKHVNESPPRKYTYVEWTWFLRLMGEEEASSKTHRTPTKYPEPVGDGDVGIQQAGAQYDKLDDCVEWSWLGERSPLLGETPEAQWVLDRLSMRLEHLLRRLHERHGNCTN